MIIVDDETNVKHSLGNSDTYRKVLGVNWKTTSNEFLFEFSDILDIASILNVTKQNILKFSPMFFHSLGLICLNLLQPKLLFRNVVTEKM